MIIAHVFNGISSSKSKFVHVLTEDRWIPRGIVANVLDCDTVVSEFELQSRWYHIYQPLR